jgi:hypothetical protein
MESYDVKNSYNPLVTRFKRVVCKLCSMIGVGILLSSMVVSSKILLW